MRENSDVVVLIKTAFSAVIYSANIYVGVPNQKRIELTALHTTNPLKSSQCRYISYLASSPPPPPRNITYLDTPYTLSLN
jgi:hypothetical protein